MIKALGEIISAMFWLLKRFFERQDANEPQRTLDKARNDSASGNDAALNADLDAARDRLRDKNSRP